LGFHPFFLKRLTPHGRPAEISVPAPRYFPSEKAIPTGPAKPVAGRFDARTPVSLAERTFDVGYTGFAERPALLYYPDERFEVWLTPGPDVRHFYVWSPPYYEGRSAPFVCIEPMSMSVNGFARREERAWDHGVQILAPREKFSISWNIDVGERLK
jgi:galactose mutarotase-like enzyme